MQHSRGEVVGTIFNKVRQLYTMLVFMKERVVDSW
jgi:hypothetical protein